MATDRYDVIVVGSGFGGSVAAYRLAQAGRRVLVLERGKPYPPGSFARTPHEMARGFWDPSEGYQGLFDIWSFRGIEAVVSSGLGGGSLIYANVLLRKDEHWFVHEDRYQGGYESWPIGRADLEEHYDAVETMLDGQPFPLDQLGYDIPKAVGLHEAAAQLNLETHLPKLAVTFAQGGNAPGPAEPLPGSPYPNLHGLPRTTCRLCGECDIGCNYGSKNTLDHTYLSAAKHHGAEIKTRCEVRQIATRDGGFALGYVEHLPEREGMRTNTRKLPIVSVTADRIVLAAGALGTPFLLLRNRRNLPGLSPALGTRFSGNGDLLTLVTKADRVLDPSRGPVITSAVRVPDTVDGGTGRGYYVEDAGFPAFASWLMETSQAPGTIRRFARFAIRRLWERLTGEPRSVLGAEIGELMGHAELSSRSMPLLGMGRDVPDGVMGLRRRYLDVDWSVATSKDYFDRVRGTMSELAEAMGGTLSDNPLWWLGRVITVHPLGGCPMATSRQLGVVDGWGQSFDHPGLYVADGSVMPGPVGPNPALTIAAFADRLSEHLLEESPHA